MMSISKNLGILAVSALLGAGPAFAQDGAGEDDLLKILDGQNAGASAGGAQALAKTPLRKLAPNMTAEQNIFFQFIEKSDFEKALFQWSPAFEKTDFIKTANGQALKAYLLFQNQLTVSGLEDLLMIQDANNVDKDLVQLWRQAAGETHPAWAQVWIEKWNPQWTEIFGVNAEIQVRSRQINGFDQMDLVKDLMVKSKPGTKERAMLQWQLVLALVGQERDKAADNSRGQAATALAHLMKQPQNPVGQDLMEMTAARMLYQNGYLDAAIKYYQKVPKSSDYFFEAQEEMGWAYIRKGQPQDTLAVTRTLTQPYFAVMVGPESSFLRTLAQLKVCDYSGVHAALNQFRTDFRERTAEMVRLSDNADTPAVRDLIAKRADGKIKFAEMGPTMKMIPRWTPRDAMMGSLIVFERSLQNEARRAGELYARSLSNATDRVGFNASLEALKNDIEARRRSAEVQVFKRVQALAADEVAETQAILSKLHVVEAEMLQQSTLVDRVAKARPEKKTILTGAQDVPAKFQLKFPVEKELWFDELAHYNVNLKGGCEARSTKQ
jgi:hypothetical protein